jgi:hypothetical protein
MRIVSLRGTLAASLLVAATCADETPSADQRAPDAPAPGTGSVEWRGGQVHHRAGTLTAAFPGC